MIIRILLALCLIALVTMCPLWISGPFVLLYALRYTAYELIIFAVFLDGFYGLHSTISVPWYMLVTIVSLIIVEYLKPLISVYN